MSKINIIHIIIFFTFYSFAHLQIARDIGLKFLLLDTDGDHLLSSSELIGQKPKHDESEERFAFWRKYQTSIYPHTFWKKYDTDQDGKISFLQLHKIVSVKMKRHSHVWPKNSQNILANMKTQDYFLLCDIDQNKSIQQEEFVVCIRAFIIYEFIQYPFKIKSKLYPNKTIGYDFEDFKKLWPKIDGSQHGQKQLQKLFQKFQWSQTKVKQDIDVLIGSEEGKFLQPTILYFYLDTNKDEVLDKEEAMRYFRKHGGQQAFGVVDFTGDQKLDQAQLTAYFLFALCIEDCQDQHTSVKRPSAPANNQKMIMTRSQAIFDVLKELKNDFVKKKSRINITSVEDLNAIKLQYEQKNINLYQQL